ncbi:Aminotransferase, class IV [gut metagenome]|uniref:Aminotransferase, class IV n=1 Tax=gut metagenome TaxID=749906 RepID=J9GTD7_9ZZZZ
MQLHTERCNHTRAVFWKEEPFVDLQSMIVAPMERGIFKCRIVYGREIEEVTYTPYQMRQVNALRLVVDDTVDYTYKSTDREALNRLYAQRDGADDVLIVKQGRLTDTSIGNVAFFDGQKWHTPLHPLLKGTMRAFLIERKVIEEKDIFVADLRSYSKIMIFNAMIDWGNLCIPVDNLYGGSPCFTFR